MICLSRVDATAGPLVGLCVRICVGMFRSMYHAWPHTHGIYRVLCNRLFRTSLDSQWLVSGTELWIMSIITDCYSVSPIYNSSRECDLQPVVQDSASSLVIMASHKHRFYSLVSATEGRITNTVWSQVEAHVNNPDITQRNEPWAIYVFI